MLSVNPSFFPLPLWNSHSKQVRNVKTVVERTWMSPICFEVCKLMYLSMRFLIFSQANVAFLVVGDLKQELCCMYKIQDSQGLVLLKQKVVYRYPLFAPFHYSLDTSNMTFFLLGRPYLTKPDKSAPISVKWGNGQTTAS